MSLCNNLADLPTDILLCIALKLPVRDLLCLARVAHAFRICLSDKVWKSRCQQLFSVYCQRPLPENLSYRLHYRDLTLARLLKGNYHYTVFNNNEPRFCKYNHISLIYPVSPFVVCEGGHSIYTDIYIDRIPNRPFVIVRQSQRTTILQCPIPSVGDDIPRVAIDDIPDNNLYKNGLRRGQSEFPLREIIYESHLPQFLSEAKAHGYCTVVESVTWYPTVRKEQLIKYRSLFHFTRHIPE